MARYRGLILIVLILLLAAGLRLYGLNNLSPPGLSHDEVANWLIDRSILDEGNYAVYYTAAYGHEAGFHYLQALFVWLLGDHALALRLPSAFLGLLGVAVSFALTRRLFGLKVALITAAWLAGLFWPVFYSRQGLRAIMLPVTSGLSAYFWWRGWERDERPLRANAATADFLLAGLFAGLSLHTYMAGRALPIFYALFIGYLALFHRMRWRLKWRGILLFVAVYVLVAAPLVSYLLAHPEAEFRISEVDGPLRALRAGNPRPVLENGLRIMGTFGLKGDSLWRQNVAGRPVFTPLPALLFYSGIGLSLWRYRDSRHAFLVLWLLTALVPSLVTIDAPSSIRMSNSLVVLTIFPALVIHSLEQLSTVFARLSTVLAQNFPIWLLTFLLVFDIGSSLRAIFIVWPAHDEVEFVHQRALTEIAAYVDSRPGDSAAAVGGWTPDTMDAATLVLSLGGDQRPLRFFDPRRTLVIPAAAAGQESYILHPNILPLPAHMEQKLRTWAAWQETDSFTAYVLDSPTVVQPQVPAEVNFGDELRFLGYDWSPSCRGEGESSTAAWSCQLVSYWRVLSVADGPRSLFLHLVDEAGDVVAQDDGLGAPAVHWQPGDILLQHHSLEAAAAGPYALRLGVYRPPDGPRLRTVGAAAGGSPGGQEFTTLSGYGSVP